MSENTATEEFVPVQPRLKDSLSEDRVSVASNWKLVWWRFRKNRLALASTVLLILFYLVVLFPDFFATQDPQATEARLAFIPAQGIGLSTQGGLHLTAPAVA